MTKILTDQSGFTLMELLVASGVALMIMGMSAQSVNSMRNLYLHDIVRTRVNQDTRGAMDFIGVNVRQAGENFTMAFPAIQITNGSSGAPDQLFLRRNLLDEVLNVCVGITSGSAVSDVVFAGASVNSGCDYASNHNNFNSWSSYRTSQPGNQVKAYIYNLGTKQGEFFTYSGETNTGSVYSIQRTAGTWANDYPAGVSAVYILEQYHFSMDDDLLQLVVNSESANALNVGYGFTDFQVIANMQDGTIKTELLISDDWTDVANLDVTLSGGGSFSGSTLDNTLKSQFFPRNILSN